MQGRSKNEERKMKEEIKMMRREEIETAIRHSSADEESMNQ